MAVAAGLLQSFNVAVFDIWLLVSCDLPLLLLVDVQWHTPIGRAFECWRVVTRVTALAKSPLNCGKVIFEWQRACRDPFPHQINGLRANLRRSIRLEEISSAGASEIPGVRSRYRRSTHRRPGNSSTIAQPIFHEGPLVSDELRLAGTMRFTFVVDRERPDRLDVAGMRCTRPRALRARPSPAT